MKALNAIIRKLNNMLKKLILLIILIASILVLSFVFKKESQLVPAAPWWEFASIDTMKYSRDIAREKLNDSSFNEVIDRQVRDIAGTGATHVAIATPYDSEFYPFLKKWVDAARKHNLNIWFRGNFSGWEGWFGYPDISRDEHIKKTEEFILKNKNLFKDGDVFTACPECENGGPGDPRHNGDVEGHREFLIDEYKITKAAFKKMGKNVASNFNSMNGDVARIIMNKETTRSLDGIVTIDHYVSTPEKLIEDVRRISRASGGKIVLGEFGVPIPDIHGKMSEEEQAEWVENALGELRKMPEVVGINYWTNTGSTTQLWDNKGVPRLSQSILTSFYKAHIVKVRIMDETGSILRNAELSMDGARLEKDDNGTFNIPYFEDSDIISITADGYFPKEVKLSKTSEQEAVLIKKDQDIIYQIRRFSKNLL